MPGGLIEQGIPGAGVRMCFWSEGIYAMVVGLWIYNIYCMYIPQGIAKSLWKPSLSKMCKLKGAVVFELQVALYI